MMEEKILLGTECTGIKYYLDGNEVVSDQGETFGTKRQFKAAFKKGCIDMELSDYARELFGLNDLTNTYIKQSLRNAKELGYPSTCLNEIASAKSTNEISIIMRKYRFETV